MPFEMTKPIAELQADAIARVNQQAETIRGQYLTPGTGQALTYLCKLMDAQAYQAAGYPMPASAYPWINAEATATGKTPQAVAELIIAAGQRWHSVGAQIEAARQQALAALKAAMDGKAVYDAEVAFNNAVSRL